MQKILSIFLCVIICISFAALPVSADEDYVLSEEQIALLTAIDMYDSETMLSDKLTRAEFADMLVKSIFTEPQYLIEGTESFNDVNADHPYYGSVMLLKNLKVTYGDGQGNFNPEEEILVNDAIIMAVRFLGYTKIAESTGYIPFAALKGISKDMHYSYDEALNRYNALLLVFNVLNTDVSDRFVDETIASTYMNAYRNLYIVEGVVTDDGFINKEGLSTLAADEIAIDGRVFKNATGEKNLFGCNIKGYFREPVDEKSSIIALVVTKNNNQLFIESSDIENFNASERIYKYRLDDDSFETVFVPHDVTIIYNGVTLGIDDGDISVEDMIPQSGNITLFDGDGDKKYDILFINNYETYVVAATESDNKVIYMKEFKAPLELKKDKYEIFDSDGQLISFEDIRANNVISVLKSLSGDIIRIYVSNYSVSDIVISKDDDATVMTQNNGVYELSYAFINQAYEDAVPEDKRKESDNKISYALNKLEFSTLYRMYIDIFGQIAYVEPEAVSLWTAAVAVTAGNESRSSLGDDFRIQIFGLDGKMTKYKLAENVNMFYQDNTEGRVDDSTAISIVNSYIEANKTNGNRLLRYKINMKGLITDIEFPLALGVEIADINTDRMYIIQDNSSSIRFDGGVSQGKALTSAGCRVINVPVTNITSDEEYFVSTPNELFASTDYSVIAYGTDTKMLVADYFLNTGTVTNISNESAFLVSKIIERYDHEDNEVTYKLEGYKNATPITYYVEDESVVNNSLNLSGEAIKIQTGDIIAFSSLIGEGGKNIINKAVVIYDADGKIKGTDHGFFGAIEGSIAGASGDTLPEGSGIGNPVSFTASKDTVKINSLESHRNPLSYTGRIGAGYVYSYKDGNIMLTSQPLGRGAKYTSVNTSGKYVTEIYSNVISKTLCVKKLSDGKIEVKKATELDIKPYTIYGSSCSKVVWFGYWGLDVLYIIEDAR